MTPEGLVKRQVCEYLSTLPGVFFWTTKTVGTYDPTRGVYRKNADRWYIRGVSDICGLLEDGRFLAIELKSKTGRVSDHQKAFLENVNRMGGLGFVARSVEDVRAKLSPNGMIPGYL